VPTSFRVLTAIILLEAVAAWGYIAYLVAVAADEPGGWRVIGFFVMYAVAFTVPVVGLVRRRRWARAPLIVFQLLLTVPGASLVANGAPVPGLLLVVVPLICAGLLLSSSTRAALTPTANG
jgi:hypothetical protein